MMATRTFSFYFRAVLLVAFSLALFSSGAFAGQRLALPKTVEGMRRLMGDDYAYLDKDELLIVSDIDRKQLYQLASRDFLVHMHVLRREFFNKSHKVDDGKKGQSILTVFLFRDRESYVRGLRKIGIDVAVEDEENRGAVRDGYYYPGRKRNFILINYRDDYERGISTFAHELSHALMRKEFSRSPVWINEGIATMVGHSRLVDNQLRYDNKRGGVARVRKAAEAGKLPPLARVLAFTGKDFSSRTDSTPYYDASEQFCRFMYSRGQLRSLYHALRDGGNSEPVARTVARVARCDIEQLESEWNAWLKKQ